MQIAFWNTSKDLHPDFLRSLEVFYRRIPLGKDFDQEITIEEDIDRLLNREADRPGVEWLCVMGVGTIFPDQNRIIKLISKAIEEAGPNFLVMGQLIDKPHQYCGIHEQLFIVNLETYRRLGRPEFGKQGRFEARLQNYEAGESFHDGYTPKIVSPLPGDSLRKTKIHGWNFVHASLKAGMAVRNLPEELRQDKLYIYPDDDLELLNRNLQAVFDLIPPENPSQRRYLGYLLNKKLGLSTMTKGSAVQIKDREAGVFFFNTENLLVDPVWVREKREPLDVILCPCSGFLDQANLFAHGFHPKTKVILFDLNPKSIQFKKEMRRDFDGQFRNLVPYLSKLRDSGRYPFAHLGNPQTELEKLLKVFETPEAFEENWKKTIQLETEYLERNLLTQSEFYFKRLPKTGRILFHISDIFTGQNELTYGYSKMKEFFENFIERSRSFENMVVSGKDLEEVPFIGRSSDL